MTDLRTHARPFFLLPVLMLLVLALCLSGASADDEALSRELPGVWICDADPEESFGIQAQLILEPEGGMTLQRADESATWVYEGTWALEILTEYSPDYGLRDRLTLRFTSTDDPRYAESGFGSELVYYVHTESWFEGETRHTWLLTEAADRAGPEPFTEICGEDSPALFRTEGPNARVVKCKKSVSLREKTSKTSRCLVKVPLGAEVFAFPEEGEENGFIRCVYHDEYGYILSAYLAPVE